jgi:hypothetical protein
MLTRMNDFSDIRKHLDRQLDEALASDPLGALEAIGEIQRDLADRQQEAVRAAVPQHSWAEIGQALGVSKQAAHYKFTKRWEQEFKAEHKAMKEAKRAGAREKAAEVRAKRDALVEELKAASRPKI